jgi:hypothetical protein
MEERVEYGLPPKTGFSQAYETDKDFKTRMSNLGTRALYNKLKLDTTGYVVRSDDFCDFIRIGLIDITFKGKNDEEIVDLTQSFKKRILDGENFDIKEFLTANVPKAKNVVKYEVKFMYNPAVTPVPSVDEINSLPDTLKLFKPMVVVKKTKDSKWIRVVGLRNEAKPPFTVIMFSGEDGPNKLYEYDISTHTTRVVPYDEGLALVINSIQEQIHNGKIYYGCRMTTPAALTDIIVKDNKFDGGLVFKQLDGTTGKIKYALQDTLPKGGEYSSAPFLGELYVHKKDNWYSVNDAFIFIPEVGGRYGLMNTPEEHIRAIRGKLSGTFIDVDKFKNDYGPHLSHKLIFEGVQQSSEKSLDQSPILSQGGGKIKRTRKTMKTRKYSHKKTKRAHKRKTRYQRSKRRRM